MIPDEDLLRTISDQNASIRKDPRKYLLRTSYMDRLERMDLEKGIGVLQGPRRSGKTTLMRMFIRRQIGKDSDSTGRLLYVNLEDFRLSSDLGPDLLERILVLHRERHFPQGRLTMLLDEVQVVDGFEKWLRTHYDSDHDLKFFITGSNSKLLSSELGDLLTGRTHTVRVHPFSFGDFMEYRTGSLPDVMDGSDPVVTNRFLEYLSVGGIPEFLDMTDPQERHREYVDQVLSRDIMARFDIRNQALLRDMARYLLTHSSSRSTYSSMSRTFTVSKETISDYLSFLEQSYLITLLKEHRTSAKDAIRRPAKIFALDPGIINSVITSGRPDSGMVLETVVLLHLRMAGKEVFFHTDPSGNSECDFLIREDLRIVEAIQVCRDMDEPKTFRREMKGLLNAARACGLTKGRILTMRRSGSEIIDGITIQYQRIPEFLLEIERTSRILSR